MLKAIRRLFRKPELTRLPYGEKTAGEIVRLELSMRVLHRLIRSKRDGGLGLRTVEQILQCKEEDFLKVRGFGPVSYNDLQQRLYENGFIPKPKYLAVRPVVRAAIDPEGGLGEFFSNSNEASLFEIDSRKKRSIEAEEV